MILNPNEDLLKQIQEQIKNIQNSIANIQGDITNIENNVTNITEDVEEIQQQGTFLNLAPKIGYYQEDTVEVLSKYNMNYIDEDSYRWCCFKESDGRQTMFFTASDGSPETQFQIYSAYRVSDNSKFYFKNEPITIPDFITEKKLTFLETISANDDYIIIRCIDSSSNSSYFIVDTNNSSDSSTWTKYKQIPTNLLSNWLHIKYIRKYNKIVIIRNISRKLKDINNLSFEVYDYNTLSKVYSRNIPGPAYIFTLNNNNYSFSKNTTTKNPEEADDELETYSQTLGQKVIYLEKQELLVYIDFRTSSYVYNQSKQKITVDNLQILMNYKVPISILESNSGEISIQNTKGSYDIINHKSVIHDIFNRYNDEQFMENIYHNNLSINPSYNDSNSIVNYCMYQRDFPKYFIISVKYDEQVNSGLETGLKNMRVSEPEYVTPPDTSVWGKYLFSGTVLNGYIMLIGGNGSGSIQSPFLVKEWNYLKNYESKSYVEPSIGKYKIYEKNYEDYSSKYINGYISSLDDSGNVIKIIAVDGDNMELEFYQIEDTIENDNTFVLKEFSKSESQLLRSIDRKLISNNKFTTDPERNYFYLRSIYNNLGNYIVVFYKEITFEQDSEKYNYQIYFKVIKADNSIVEFSPKFKSKWSSNFKSFNETMWNDISNNISVGNNIQSGSNRIVFDKNNIGIVFEKWRSDNIYTATTIRITFNEELTDFTMSDIILRTNWYSFSSNISRPLFINHSKEYGLVSIGNGWVLKPTKITTQKPLIKGTGKEYTVDEFLNGNCNQYYMYLQSAQGLVCYIPNIPIFLGGYFSVIENPIEVILKANSKNYIYLERDPSNRKNIIATSSTDLTITEGSKQFSKICVACVTTDDANPIDVEYYRINTGYNSYTFQ